ncbi:MAG: hypothetical protein ACP5D2_03760 [Candidatus Nanoarchaeia archaeon]
MLNRIEKLGEKDFNHIGCEGDEEAFIEFLTQFVPKIGMKRKVKFTVETKEKPIIEEDYKKPRKYTY